MEKFYKTHSLQSSMAEKTLKISKKSLYISIISVILVIVLLVYFLKLQPEMARASEVQEFKKALYESTLCQYSCPLSNVTFDNLTQVLPNRTCTDSCLADLRDKNFSSDDFADAELTTDALVADIENIVRSCNTANRDPENAQVLPEEFFTCIADNLEDLKTDYSYLN